MDIILFIRLSRLRWIGHVNRMDKERKVYNISYNQPQGTRVRGRPKNRWMDCVLSDIKKRKIRTFKEQSRDKGIWRRRSLKRRRPPLGCSATEEDIIYIYIYIFHKFSRLFLGTLCILRQEKVQCTF